MTEDEMVGWHYQLNGHEFEQVLGDGEGQGSLACYSPWGCKQSNMTKRLNNNIPEVKLQAVLTGEVQYWPTAGVLMPEGNPWVLLHLQE